MNIALIQVLEGELKYVRALRCSENLNLVRASLDREEVLLAELARTRGESTNVLPMAAGFARRDEDPGAVS